jgi:cell division protein FtsL
MALAQPKYAPPAQRIVNPRSARTATQTRIVKNARARYRGIVQVTVSLLVVLTALIMYVMLTSNETRLSYELGRAQVRRTALQEQDEHLDDRIASLESDQRLAALAAKLGMRQPQRFAMVRLDQPKTVVAQSRFPVFASIAGLLGGPR